MVRRVSSAEAKAQLSALVAEVAHAGRRVVIERRGKPMAALVSVADLDHLEEGHATSSRPQGALALVGAWREVETDDMDRVVGDIYASREQDKGRPVELEA